MAQSLIKGPLVLTSASLIPRLIGLIYRMYLVRLAGNEVIGLFQMVFPLYFTMIVLASAGIPLAVSKMVADRSAIRHENGIRRIMRMSIMLSLVMGTLTTLLLFASAHLISYKILGDSRTFLALTVIAPSLPAISLAGVFKGFFQGTANMTPVATSQIIEQLVHVSATIALITAYKTANEQVITAVLAAGSLLGDLVGLAFIGFAYRNHTRRRWNKRRLTADREGYIGLVKELAILALPMTIGRLIVSLNQTINSAMIPNLLKAGGIPVKDATIMFGELTGMAMNLLTIPSVFTASMATNLVPNVASSKARRSDFHVQAKTMQSIKVTFVIGGFFAALFLSLGIPMCKLFFHSVTAGILLMILTPGGFALYLQHVLTGILQGLNKTHLPMICSMTVTAFSSGMLYLTLGKLNMGIKGAAISMSLSMILGALTCLVCVRFYIRLLPEVSYYMRTAVAAASAGLFAFVSHVLLMNLTHNPAAALALACAGSLLLYIMALYFLRIVTSAQFIRLVKGSRSL
jgi:stage V sporulation protein B